MKKALILGASSGIGRALTEELAKDGWELILCSRNTREMEAIAAHVFIRYRTIAQVIEIDVIANTERKKLIEHIVKENGITDFFITIGEIMSEDNGLQDDDDINRLIQTNFNSIILFVSGLLRVINLKDSKNIVFLSSIASTRPRKNNLIYATSKSAVDFYLRGMQHLLADTNINIQIIRLGYIDTSMSFGKKLLFPAISPQNTAGLILKNIKSKKRIHYIPGYWKYISIMVRLIPWVIYKKISF
jgi:short-subunit dehydrogenase